MNSESFNGGGLSLLWRKWRLHLSLKKSLKNKFYDKFLLVIIDLDSRVTISNISVHTEVKILYLL